MSDIASRKVRSPEEAVTAVRPGMLVFVGSVSAEPTSLTAALWARAGELSNITILSGTMLSGYPFLQPEAGDVFRLRTWFMPGTLIGGPVKEIAADFLPMSWAQTMKFLMSSPIDVAMVQVSPANADGFYSFGISASNTHAAVRSAKVVIAEVNEAMPRTRGDSLVHESELDILVYSNHPLAEFPHRAGDATDDAIGLLAAERIPDGAFIQYGIGTIPGATLKGLVTLGRRNLRVISQLTDPARQLIESGACSVENPKATVGEILGTQALYRWVHENPAVWMADAFSTHSIEGLSRIPHLASVNSALEVDLYGQVNSESIGGRQSGGIGGSLDFAIGGQLAGALSLVALRSTTTAGATRIVAALMPGAVTLPRTLVQVVITEHGVADLRALSVRERARAIASIAAPEHRDQLLRAASRWA